MNLTENQKKAVQLDNRNILVSAAAGSGKTSVLVNRIIRRITSGENPVDIDRLLIMTFTSAAAKEMKDRIRKAIEKGLETDPKDENLIRQSVLIHNAQIMTIHSFCQSIIRDNFERIGLDPNFRVADENEAKLIRKDVLDEVLEHYYEEGKEDFLCTVESISGAKSDVKLESVVTGLYFFAQSNPEPDRFIEECIGAYRAEGIDEFLNLPMMDSLVDLFAARMKVCLDMAESAMKLVDGEDELRAYLKTLNDDYEQLSKLTIVSDYDDFREKISACVFGRMATVRKDKLSDETILIQQKILSIRNSYKDSVKKVQKAFAQPLSKVYETVSECRPVAECLVSIVKDFDKLYSLKKTDKNIIDFNDMEHMAISILKDNPDVAASYRDKFEEIYVDEYQDSNMTQETLVGLIKRDEPKGNVFMVGDVKQSIYRFRQARPDLFVGKYDAYTDEESPNQRIILNDNFRSRKTVIDSVNEVFRIIMTKDFGNIEYDSNAELKYGATYYDEADALCDSKTDYDTELMLVSGDELSKMELEAHMIVGKIRELIDSEFQVYDTNTSKLRPITYKDIVILLRSYKGCESVFRQVFSDNDIPLSIAANEGYFVTTEVQTVLSFLSVIDNPLQDIPLAAVMHSPIGGFTNEEMALLRVNCGNERLYYTLKNAYQKCTCENDDKNKNVVFSEELANKCAGLTDKLEYYRKKAAYTTVYGILQEIIDKEYSDYVRSGSNSQQKMANLDMLMVKAQEYGRTSFKGLFNFVRYMDLIKKYEIEAGEAGILSEEDDVVRIMTIHASKGLEFPVCFVAGIEKDRNARDETGKVVWDVTFGVGIEHVDLGRRVRTGTICQNIIKQQLNRENIAEEMRILYVAMTRAREKLILVGHAADGEIFNVKITSISSCKSYLDMLGVVFAAKDGCFEHIKISSYNASNIVAQRVESTLKRESKKDEVLDFVRKFDSNAYEPSENLKQLDAKYAFEDEYVVPAKLSVSELKKRAYAEADTEDTDAALLEQSLYDDTDSYIPKFMREEGETVTGGSFYGTAFHRILELWEYSQEEVEPSQVEAFAREMYEKKRMEEEQINAINGRDIALFLNSETGRRLYSAKKRGKLYREQPFVIGIPKWEVGNAVDTEYHRESSQVKDEDIVLVQGIIDAFFEEDDGIVILDYKTDRVREAEELVKRYKVQLEYYKKALGQVTGKNIKEMIIYSSRLGKSIKL